MRFGNQAKTEQVKADFDDRNRITLIVGGWTKRKEKTETRWIRTLIEESGRRMKSDDDKTECNGSMDSWKRNLDNLTRLVLNSLNEPVVVWKWKRNWGGLLSIVGRRADFLSWTLLLLLIVWSRSGNLVMATRISLSSFSLQSVVYFFFSRIALFWNWGIWGGRLDREREVFWIFVGCCHFAFKECCCYFVAIFSS